VRINVKLSADPQALELASERIKKIVEADVRLFKKSNPHGPDVDYVRVPEPVQPDLASALRDVIDAVEQAIEYDCQALGNYWLWLNHTPQGFLTIELAAIGLCSLCLWLLNQPPVVDFAQW